MLMKAIVAAEMMDTLDSQRPLTVFAPTNDAFYALPEATLASLLRPDGKSAVVELLKCGMVAAMLHYNDLGPSQEVESMQGGMLLIKTRRGANDEMTVNGRNVIAADIGATNGVMHIIDGVLLPPTTATPTATPTPPPPPQPTAVPTPEPNSATELPSPEDLGKNWWAQNGNCPQEDVALQLCYRYRYEYGLWGTGPLSAPACKSFAHDSSQGCSHEPLWQFPYNSNDEGVIATAKKIYRVDPNDQDVGCVVNTYEVGEMGFSEGVATKAFEARCMTTYNLVTPAPPPARTRKDRKMQEVAPVWRQEAAGADSNRSFSSSVRQRGLSLPLLRDSTTSGLHVDVVITWHCESIEWISDIAPELYPYVTVVLLHKVDASDLTKPECQRHSIPNTLLDTVYTRLPNKGRYTHSPFAYISDHYESLASFTVFMQADRHWSIAKNWIPSAQSFAAQSFASNAEALNHFIPMVLETRARFVPISPIINNEPVLFVDRDSNANKKEQDRYDPPQLKKFDVCVNDIPNRVRETHRVLFGASPCSHRTFPFVAGFQFIVRKDMILARPRPIWEGIARLAYSNCTDFGYAVERLSINLFNSSEVIAVPTSTFEMPLYCKVEGKPSFHEPFDAALAEDFWTKYWSCDSSNDSEVAAWQTRRAGGVGVGQIQTNVPAAPVVNCGGHSAKSCGECGTFEGWCNGDCEWDDSIDACNASSSSIHPAYTRLTRMRPFQPVEDEHGRYVNVILVRSPFSKEEEELYEKYKGDILFLGIMSSEAYPLLSPNPWTTKFRPKDYIGRFPGWLNMYRSPESIFPQNISLIQMSHSDFSVVETDYDAELRAGKHEKLYDFMYVMTNTENEVKDGCAGWGSFAKNWPLAKKALDVMCSEMNLTGVVLGIVDSNGNSCEIPPSCQGRVLRAGYVNYYKSLEYMRQSRFLLVPAVYDASPRVIIEAMSLNVPVLMNENIVGGWKYICKETGVFFSGISSLKGSVVELMGNLNTYTPRSYVQQHYGRHISGKQLKGFVEKFVDYRVKLPKKMNLLIPTEPRRLHDSKTKGTLTSDGSSETEITRKTKTKAQPPLSSSVGSSWAAKNKIPSFVISSDEGGFGSFLDANGGRGDETISWHPAASGMVQSNANEWGRLTGGPTINVSLFSGKGKDQFGPHAAGCYVSHHSLIRSLLNEVQGGHPRASAYVVFEDDARCVRGWREALDNALGRLPKDWDIFFIGGRPISYFHHFDKTMLNEATGTSLRRDICKGMFGKAVGPRAPGGGRNISRGDPFWRAMYLVHTHAYVLNPDRIERVLEVLERKDDSDVADPIDQRLANSMASGGLIAYMSAENLCEQADLLPTYAPDWDGVSPQPWMGHFGFPEEAVQQHPAILASHMWGKMILDEDDGPECKSGTY